MIEECSYCGEEHETGEQIGEIGGFPFKECPNMPPDIVALIPPVPRDRISTRIHRSRDRSDYGILEAEVIE